MQGEVIQSSQYFFNMIAFDVNRKSNGFDANYFQLILKISKK